MESRPTIISTNLTPEQLSVRYSLQIASRLLGTYRLIQLSGRISGGFNILKFLSAQDKNGPAVSAESCSAAGRIF